MWFCTLFNTFGPSIPYSRFWSHLNKCPEWHESVTFNTLLSLYVRVHFLQGLISWLSQICQKICKKSKILWEFECGVNSGGKNHNQLAADVVVLKCAQTLPSFPMSTIMMIRSQCQQWPTLPSFPMSTIMKTLPS